MHFCNTIAVIPIVRADDLPTNMFLVCRVATLVECQVFFICIMIFCILSELGWLAICRTSANKSRVWKCKNVKNVHKICSDLTILIVITMVWECPVDENLPNILLFYSFWLILRGRGQLHHIYRNQNVPRKSTEQHSVDSYYIQCKACCMNRASPIRKIYAWVIRWWFSPNSLQWGQFITREDQTAES